MKAIEAHFNSVAPHYVKGPLAHRLPKHLSGLGILDLGCGSGYYSRFLMTRGANEILAIDQSQEMLKGLARRGLQTRRADLETLAIPERSFDLILAMGVFEFIESPESLLGQMRT